jgi:hypothetical protein
MEITIREFKHADVVTVSGRVDSSTAPKLDQTLKGLMDDKHYNIVLDLSGVEIPPSGSLRSWNWLAWTKFSGCLMIW